MDNLSKIISFVLGLIVVMFFFAVVTGKINLKGKLPIFTKSTSPTVTAIPTPTSGTNKIVKVTTQGSAQNPTYNNYQQKNNPNTTSKIPSTGSPTLLIPILFSVLGSGLLIKKTSKKA